MSESNSDENQLKLMIENQDNHNNENNNEDANELSKMDMTSNKTSDSKDCESNNNNIKMNAINDESHGHDNRKSLILKLLPFLPLSVPILSTTTCIIV